MCVRIAELTSIYYIFSMIIRHVRGAMWLLILLLRWEPYMSPTKKSSVEFVQVLGVCHWQSSLGRPARFVSGKRKYSYQVGMLYFPQEMDSRASAGLTKHQTAFMSMRISYRSQQCGIFGFWGLQDSRHSCYIPFPGPEKLWRSFDFCCKRWKMLSVIVKDSKTVDYSMLYPNWALSMWWLPSKWSFIMAAANCYSRV